MVMNCEKSSHYSNVLKSYHHGGLKLKWMLENTVY